MGIGVVLKELIDLKGTNVNELSAKIGVNSSTIYSIIRRDNMKVDFDILLKIAESLNVDIKYFYDKRKTESFQILSKADEELLKNYRSLDTHGKEAVNGIMEIELKRLELHQKTKDTEKDSSKIIHLDFISDKVSAGEGFDLNDEFKEKLSVYMNRTTARADYAVQVSGSSMEPKYYDGDILLISKQPDIEIGEYGIFIKDNKGYVKQKGIDRLISLNKDYPDIFPSDYGTIECKGKVIDVLKDEWIAK